MQNAIVKRAESENLNISKSSKWPFNRSSRNLQIVIVNRAESENLHFSKIRNGGRPPYWKYKLLYLRHRLTDQDETAGTCRLPL